MLIDGSLGNASAVQFTPAGLIVLAGITDVHTALAKIDEQSRPRADPIADRPAVGDVPEGTEFLAIDVDDGTTYKKIDGVWVQTGAGVNGGGGMRELNRVEWTTFTTATGGAIQDVTGAVFPTNSVQSSSASVIDLYLPNIRMGTFGSAVKVIANLSIWTADSVTQLALAGSTPTMRHHLTATTPTAATATATTIQIAFPSLPRVRLAADTAANSYRLRIQLSGVDGSGGVVTDMTVVIVGNATTQIPVMRHYTVAS